MLKEIRSADRVLTGKSKNDSTTDLARNGDTRLRHVTGGVLPFFINDAAIGIASVDNCNNIQIAFANVR